MKLISMTDFVLQEWEKDLYTDDFSKIIKNYADFLKQPLKLGMFVPCDEDGNPFNEILESYSDQYQQAKERVLFERFSVVFAKSEEQTMLKNKELYINFYEEDFFTITVPFSDLIVVKTIEDLVIFNLTLTESAIKTFKL